MKVFYSEAHRQHNPPFEVLDGGQRVPYMENPEQLDSILGALHQTAWSQLLEPDDFGLRPILAVHTADYIEFLASAWKEWLMVSPENRASPAAAGLLPATFALRRCPHVPASILGRAGYYMMDLSAVLVAGTYEAALASANCALSAARAITKEGSDDSSRSPSVVRRVITPVRIMQLDTASSTMPLLPPIGFLPVKMSRSLMLITMWAMARRISSITVGTY